MATEEESSLALEIPIKNSKENNDESRAKIIAASYSGPLPLSSKLWMIL